MTDSDPSPFTERKSNPWLWIVPSVILHVVILVVWLSMPEPPPRMPGERKLTIQEEQAEQLQQHVEDANLRELRAEVAQMQAIKERMARIRAEKMQELRTFEETMLQEAPNDIAGLISELLEVQESVRELIVSTMASLEKIREASEPVESLLDKDPVAGIRALKDLVPVRNEIAGVRDVLEENLNTAKAIAGSIRTKTEWISDTDLLNRIDRLLDGVESMNEGMNELNQEIGSSVGGRPRRFLNELAEAEESSINTLQAYEEMVNKGDQRDNRLKRDYGRLQWRLKEAFRRPANPEVFAEFLNRQETFVRQATELQSELEAM
jgi:hypothetical protein